MQASRGHLPDDNKKSLRGRLAAFAKPRAFGMSAFDALAAKSTHGELHKPTAESLVQFLDAYPVGVQGCSVRKGQLETKNRRVFLYKTRFQLPLSNRTPL